MKNQKDSREEQAFRTSSGLSLSPSGHSYQLSYAVQAEKNSKGVVFFPYSNGLVCFKFKGETLDLIEEDPLEEFKKEVFFDPKNKVLVYYLGHKYNVYTINEILKNSLSKREQLVSSNFPQINAFLTKLLIDLNCTDLRKYRVPTITYLLFTNDPKEERGVKIRPNNKVVHNYILEGGGIEKEDLEALIQILYEKKVLKTKLLKFNEKVLLDISKLKAKDYSSYEIYYINFEKGVIELENR